MVRENDVLSRTHLIKIPFFQPNCCNYTAMCLHTPVDVFSLLNIGDCDRVVSRLTLNYFKIMSYIVLYYYLAEVIAYFISIFSNLPTVHFTYDFFGMIVSSPFGFASNTNCHHRQHIIASQ